MEWRGLSQHSYDKIIFEILIHVSTLCYDAEFTVEGKTILDNSLLEQEDAWVATWLGSLTIEVINDDCVIVPQSPMLHRNQMYPHLQRMRQ